MLKELYKLLENAKIKTVKDIYDFLNVNDMYIGTQSHTYVNRSSISRQHSMWQEIADYYEISPKELLKLCIDSKDYGGGFRGLELLWDLAGAPEDLKHETDYSDNNDSLEEMMIFAHIYGGDRLKLDLKHINVSELDSDRVLAAANELKDLGYYSNGIINSALKDMNLSPDDSDDNDSLLSHIENDVYKFFAGIKRENNVHIVSTNHVIDNESKWRRLLNDWNFVAVGYDATGKELLEALLKRTNGDSFPGIEALWILAGAPDEYRDITDYSADKNTHADSLYHAHIYGGNRLTVYNLYGPSGKMSLEDFAKGLNDTGNLDVFDKYPDSTDGLEDYIKAIKDIGFDINDVLSTIG